MVHIEIPDCSIFNRDWVIGYFNLSDPLLRSEMNFGRAEFEYTYTRFQDNSHLVLSSENVYITADGCSQPAITAVLCFLTACALSGCFPLEQSIPKMEINGNFSH